MALLDVRNLSTSFHMRSGIVRAAQNVDLTLERGETLGIVGESGSGKSVTCYSIMRLIPQPPGRIESGQVLYDGQDLLTLSEAQITYAASDVLHLHALKERLDAMLQREGRTHLAESAFGFLPTRAALDLGGWSDEDIFSHS